MDYVYFVVCVSMYQKPMFLLSEISFKCGIYYVKQVIFDRVQKWPIINGSLLISSRSKEHIALKIKDLYNDTIRGKSL
jgi:hypothetical protein